MEQKRVDELVRFLIGALHLSSAPVRDPLFPAALHQFANGLETAQRALANLKASREN